MYNQNISNSKIRRGNVFFIEQFKNIVGHEQDGSRPVLIVSNDFCNVNSDVIEVVFLTASTTKKDLPTHVTIRSTSKVSTALCEHIHSISKQRLKEFVGSCTKEEMRKIDAALIISLGLDDGRFNEPSAPTGAVEEVEKVLNLLDENSKVPHEEISDTLIQLATIKGERDTYKSMYENLLDKVVSK